VQVSSWRVVCCVLVSDASERLHLLGQTKPDRERPIASVCVGFLQILCASPTLEHIHIASLEFLVRLAFQCTPTGAIAKAAY